MKAHLRALGFVFISVGSFIAAFILLVLVLGALNSLGTTQGKPDQTFFSAVAVFFLLVYPAIWIIQTGLALLGSRRSGRLSGIVFASILFVGLNVALLLLKDQPGKARNGIVVFHLLMILIGLYGLIVLVPPRVKQFLD
jgi:hypothetical protein